jgi:sugar lactone lactonase YvrE
MKRNTLLASLSLSLSLSFATACAPAGPADVPQLDLPGDKFYPESLSVAKDGTLYVGSLATAQVIKFAPQSTAAEVFLAPGVVRSVAGVLVDDNESLLYLCDNDLSPTAPGLPTVRSFRLQDGAPAATYTFPGGGFCNDLAFDGQRNLYVADSAGKVLRLAKGSSTLAVWSTAPGLAPSSPQGYGADGITWDGQSSLYVNTFSDGRLLRIAINADGSAGAATQLEVAPALNSPDGMRLLDDGSLLLVEGAGRLTRVTVNGSAATATVLADSLNAPTSVVKYEQDAWISEGQLGHLFGFVAGPPKTPFQLRRVTLP